MSTPSYRTIYTRSLKPTLEMPRDQLSLLVEETTLVPSTGHARYRVPGPRMAIGTQSEESLP